METTQTRAEGEQGVRARRRVRCPHCRALDPEIIYGQYTWNTQRYDPETEEYGTSSYSYEGDIVIGANCGNCDVDLSQYLIHRSVRLPDDTPYSAASFSHDVEIPRRPPLSPARRRSDYGNIRDVDLVGMIASQRALLGALLDEVEERKYRGTWKEERRG